MVQFFKFFDIIIEFLLFLLNSVVVHLVEVPFLAQFVVSGSGTWKKDFYFAFSETIFALSNSEVR
jgi:hypothetical protein